jgi:5'-nucleotidase (lipoprotein e(P4) family)
MLDRCSRIVAIALPRRVTMLPLMLARARLPSTALVCAIAASFGCRAADVDAQRELEQLRARVVALESERDAIAAALETEQGCRQQVIRSLSAFAAGPYSDVTAQIAAEAKAALERRVAARERDEKLALVLDIDETVLSNLEQLEGSGFCFVREDWNAWVERGEPPPIAGALELIDYARAHDVAVVLITGRHEPQREATERALRRAGVSQWDRLILREQADLEVDAAEFKSGRRAALEAEGYVIALALGDQQSDLDGGHVEQTMLMPNPFYLVK